MPTYLDASDVAWPETLGDELVVPHEDAASLFPEIEIASAEEISIDVESLSQQYGLVHKYAGTLCQKMTALCNQFRFGSNVNAVGRFFKKSDGLVRYECIFMERKFFQKHYDDPLEEALEAINAKASFSSTVFAKVTYVWKHGLDEVPTLELVFDEAVIPRKDWDFLGLMLVPFCKNFEYFDQALKP